MRIIKTILCVTLALIFFPSCYEKQNVIGVAYLHTYKSDSLEIELPYNVEGRGNIHHLDLKKYHYQNSHWIYLSKVRPTVSADSLLLCYERGKTSYPWPQTNLKGSLRFQDSLLSIDFDLPNNDDKGIITKWTKYKFNGQYKIRTTP